VELAGWAASGATQRVVGLSVDGNEATSGRTGPRFADAFRLAARRGLRRAVHAGESSGPEGVRDALDLLLAERIDHGVRAVEDPSLVAELAARGVPLGVCPTSNVALGLVAILEQHPIDALRRAGVAVTINTDDPRLLGCDLVSEYAQCAAAFGWDQGVLIDLARASIDASFALADVKRELRADLTRFVSTDAP
jgi:adenosine deaminase